MCICMMYVCTNELTHRWIHLLALLMEPPKPSRALGTDTASPVGCSLAGLSSWGMVFTLGNSQVNNSKDR